MTHGVLGGNIDRYSYPPQGDLDDLLLAVPVCIGMVWYGMVWLVPYSMHMMITARLSNNDKASYCINNYGTT